MNDSARTKATPRQMLVIGLKLLVICAVVAAVVSGVYLLTDARYQSNIRLQKEKAIREIFDPAGSLAAMRVQALPFDGEETVYAIYDGDTLVGYCVETVFSGFGGDMALTVGFHVDESIKGVSIVSMSETPGLGSKVGEGNYLDSYDGKSGSLVLGEDVDAISGATISSRAVLDGVNRAAEVLKLVKGGAAQ
jgi:electron transport complex protein RnfG